MIYRASGLRYRYAGARHDAVHDVELAVPRGAFYAVIGPNGCGKTTLLRLLLGALDPDTGAIAYDDRPLSDWPRQELARRVGVVPQSEELVFPLSVRELVAMGRYPHLGPWRGEGAGDRSAVGAAMARCDVADLAGRAVNTLSGGERQRARLARALAQEPDTLVLDEPTASLDIAHEMGIFELLRSLADSGTTVLMVTHNLNMAARYADRLLLLDEGRPAAEGPAGEVFTAETLERVYGWPVAVTDHPGPGPDTGAPQIMPLRGADRIE
ncbi:MAG: ABC transporter ATP-binding protein [Longimicrobiales bacterium]|nr:ABC transporter ATP-binding protein [Longimicrobiales bacterium]